MDKMLNFLCEVRYEMVKWIMIWSTAEIVWLVAAVLTAVLTPPTHTHTIQSPDSVLICVIMKLKVWMVILGQ